MNSCNQIHEEKLTGKYYLIWIDSKDNLRLSYRLSSGDYTGKVPGRPGRYGFNDSMLVVETTIDENENPLYYIIDMRKDGEFANDSIFRTGPLDKSDYENLWSRKLNINLKNVTPAK